MYGDQSGEFVCGYLGLKGLRRQGDGALAGKLLAYFCLILFFSL